MEINTNKYDIKYSSLILKISLVTLFIINLSFYLFALNKGFDITDEAFYLMGYKYPNESINYFSFYHQIVGRYFSFITLDVVNVRFLKLFTALISALIFSFGLAYQLKRHTVSFIANPSLIFLFVSNLSFASFALGPQSLSYNSISASCLMLITGLSFMICSTNLSRFYHYLASITLGFFIALLFYIKFTNSLIIFPIILFLHSSLKKYAGTKTLVYAIFKFIFSIVLGIAFFILTFFKTIEIAKIKTTNYINFILETSKNSDHHNSTTLLNNYVIQLKTKFSQLFGEYYPLLILGMILLSIGILTNKKWNTYYYLTTAFAFVFFMFYKFNLFANFSENKIIDPFLVCFILLFMHSVFLSLQKKRMPQELLNAFFILLFAILFGAVGTNNEITTQFVIYLNLFVGIFIIFLSNTNIKNNIVSFYIIIISLTGSYTYVNGAMLNPYRIDGTLFTQKSKVILGDSTEIKIDKKLYNLIDAIQSDIYTKTKFKSNIPIFCNSHEIGIVYAIGSFVPSVQWNTSKNFDKAHEFFIQSRSPDLVNCCFLLSNIEPVDRRFFKMIEKQHIYFERDYISLGVYSCEIKNFKRNLTLYVPRKMLK